MKILKFVSMGFLAGTLAILPAEAREAKNRNKYRRPTGAIEYWAGPVLENVIVQPIFWGNNVNTTTQKKIGNFLSAVTNSTFMDVLNKEYNTFRVGSNNLVGTRQKINRGISNPPITIQPKNTNLLIDDSQNKLEVAAEINYQISIGKVPAPTANTYYIIYFPPDVSVSLEYGQNCSSWCGYHGAVPAQVNPSNLTYAVIPDVYGNSCNTVTTCQWGNDQFEATTYLTSNALASGITDPLVPIVGTNGAVYPEAWIGKDGMTENSALCVWQNSAALITRAEKYVVQPFWQNSTGDCSTMNFIGQ